MCAGVSARIRACKREKELKYEGKERVVVIFSGCSHVTKIAK